MIILDTNVVSELMRPQPHSSVAHWANNVGEVHTSAVTLAEVGYGIALLPHGRRREELERTAAYVFAEFGDRVVPFDSAAALIYGPLVAARDRKGRPIEVADAQIAAICKVRSAAVATRNVADFAGTGIEIIDPWTLTER